MKRNFLFFVFFLLSIVSFAQQRPVSDSTYLETRNGLVWVIRIQEFEGSERSIQEKLLGDTAQTINTLVGQAFERFQSYGEIAALAATELRISRKALNSVNTNLTNLTGENYLSYLDREIGDQLFPRVDNKAEYVMRVNGGLPINVDIIRTRGGTGTLRLKQENTNFVLDILSRNWIRLRRYDGTGALTADTSKVVNLFFTQDGKWVDNNGSGTPVFQLSKKQ